MSKVVFPLAMAALLLAVIAQAQAQGLPTPLGLRGFNLGMTLDEVRQQKFPDPTTDDVRLICPGDSLSDEADVHHPPGTPLREIGAKMCRFHAVASGKVRAAPVNVGGHDARVTFFITPKSVDPAVSERLYLILVETEHAHFDDLVEAYTTKFGKPEIRKGTPKRSLLWLNNHAMLFVAEKPRESSDVIYADKQLNKLVETLASKKGTSGADKL